MEKKRGRPRKESDVRLVPMSINVRPDEYEAWYRRAKEAGKSVSETVREALPRQPRA